MVTELLNGGSLISVLKKKGRPLKESEALPIMKGILEGLTYLHGKGIMHRDIKGDNIIFKEEVGVNLSNLHPSCVIIADFGLSHRLESGRNIFIRCGTPGCVAPEIIKARDSFINYGTICDMFSLGILFHIM